MRKFIFTVAMCGIIFLTHAQSGTQTDLNRNSFSVTAGVSIPMGYLTDLDYTYQFALAGAGTQFDFGFLFGKKRIAGLAVTLGYQMHRVDHQYLLGILEQEAGVYNLSLLNGNLHHIYTGVGAVVDIPFKMVASIEVRAMLITDLSFSYYMDVFRGNTYIVSQETGITGGLGTSLGIGLKFNTGKRIFIPVRFDYVFSAAEFYDVKLYAIGTGNIDYIDFSQRAHMIFIGTGIGVRW